MKKAIAALLLTIASTTANAEILTYDCTLHRMERGWVAERVILSVDAENKRARAYDGYIHELEGEPKDVKFKTTRNGEYRLRWNMKFPSRNLGQVRVSYTATLNPESQRLNLIARFPQVNALNRPSGSGPCKVLRSESLYDS